MFFRKRKPATVPAEAQDVPGETVAQAEQAAAPPPEDATPAASPAELAIADAPLVPEPETRPPVLSTGGVAEVEAGAVLTIDCTTLVRNWRALSGHVAPAECGAVIKADAYGCGLEPVSAALAAAGCDTLFVAHVDEARRARSVAPNATIYVLNGIVPGSAASFAEVNARPVIGNFVELAEWDAFCSTSRWQGGAAFQFDTGMNRLGLPLSEAATLAARTKSTQHGISLVMSHFACADEPNHPLNQQQIDRFRELRSMFRGIPASLANSAGIFLGAAAHFDLVRPGVALYGANPTADAYNPMRPVVELKARILQVRRIAAGETVGYGATWTAKRESRIAILAVGYADGYPRPVGGSDRAAGGEVVVGGKRCPVVGRVSMDLMVADITDLPEPSAPRGDFATLIGDTIEIDELAKWSRTISYDVLTRLGRRYHRIWKS